MPAAENDIILADFEGETHAPWTGSRVTFGDRPVRPFEGGGRPMWSGFEGKGLAASIAVNGSGATNRGSLFSPDFVINRPYINFLLAGGNHALRAAVTLWIDGRAVRTASGKSRNRLEWFTWDVREFEGKQAYVGIHELCVEDDPGHVLVDEVRLSAAPRAEPGGADIAGAVAQIQRDALKAIRRNARLAARDPWRPVYHYAPPAQRMNDPNGPAWHNGWYHVFYQHMVFIGSGPAVDVHWGHARSRDLVNWETLPIAIPPSYELGEGSVWSGNMACDKSGDPVQFVTMVPYTKHPPGRRIWAARPVDDDWIKWKKTPAMPPSALAPQVAETDSIQDPFPFSVGDRRFMVLLDRNIPIYEAVDDRLEKWEFRGLLDENKAECPNFFEVDGHWVYLSSPHQPPRYATGDFDPDTCTFTPKTEGRLNRSSGFYATTACRDDTGRTILYGITRGQKKARGWTGALAMPRILTIGADGHPRMQPPVELQSLRRRHFKLDTPLALKNKTRIINGLKGDTIEIIARFRADDARAFGLQVRRGTDGKESIPVMWREGEIIVRERCDQYPCKYEIDPVTREVVFHIFLDKGIVDACTGDGRVFESIIHYAPLENLGVSVFAEGGSVTLQSLEAWQMAPAKIDHSRLFENQ